MKREFLQLAKTYDPAKHDVTGWLASEKLDGMRCWWDGGITLGCPKDEVPWANTEKDSRYLVAPRCTGLWSRNAQPIVAPDWWLANLPLGVSLDGELWCGRQDRQFLMSTVKKLVPDPLDWANVRFMVFDMPTHQTILADGVINTPFYKKELRGVADTYGLYQPSLCYKNLEFPPENEVLRIVPQWEIESKAWLNGKLDELIAVGAEGLVIRNPLAHYTCARTGMLLKYKPWQDAEATVTGYTAGTGKLLGLMGAMVCGNFELSGFTDAEREFGDADAYSWACTHPGERMPDWVNHRRYPRGTPVTYKYRELSKDGIPVEARYWRNA